jgi:hypothetical protein
MFMGSIGESRLSDGRRRLIVPKAVALYLNLQGGETVEWLTTTTDMKFEELADDCLIVKVKRSGKQPG